MLTPEEGFDASSGRRWATWFGHDARSRIAPGSAALTVFISYRRADTQQAAGRLADRLVARFGRNSIVIDVDTDQVGRDYRTLIAEHLADAEVVLALIGPGFMAAEPDGGPRLARPNDTLRLELTTALAGGVPVIPVLIDGAELPKIDELPEDVQDLVYRGTVELAHQRFERDYLFLERQVAAILEPELAVPATPAAAPESEPDEIESVEPTSYQGTDDADEPSRPAAIAPIQWLVRHAFAAFLVGVLAAMAAGMLRSQFIETYELGRAGLGTFSKDDHYDSLLIFTFYSLAATGTLFWLAGRLGSGDRRHDLGLRFRRSDLLGIPIGAALHLAIAIPLDALFDAEGRIRGVLLFSTTAERAVVIITTIIVVGLLLPLAHELVFRVVLLRALLMRIDTRVAVVVTAGAFALVRSATVLWATEVAILAWFVAGIIMGELTRRRGDAGLALVIHASFSLTALAQVSMTTETLV